MTRRPPMPPDGNIRRAHQRMAPGGRLWSESPVRGPAVRVVAAGDDAWTYVDEFYTNMVSSPGDGAGGDTWGAAANGQDYATDSVNDEEALIRTQADHDTYGGSPWTFLTGAAGSVLNDADGNGVIFDNLPYDTGDRALGIMLSWPLQATYNNIQQYWEDYYVGQEAGYGYPGTFPANFRDEWITGYRLVLGVSGGEGHPFFVQFVTGLSDATNPAYTDGTAQARYFPPYQGVSWVGSEWFYGTLNLPPETVGMPKGSWTGQWRVRVGCEETDFPGASADIYRTSLDQVRVYTDFTVVLP